MHIHVVFAGGLPGVICSWPTACGGCESSSRGGRLTGAEYLRDSPDTTVAILVCDPEETLRLVDLYQSDLVVLDVSLSVAEKNEIVRQLTALARGITVLRLGTAFDYDTLLSVADLLVARREGLSSDAGPSASPGGLHPISCPIDSAKAACSATKMESIVARPLAAVPEGCCAPLPPQGIDLSLSAREVDVLNLLVSGLHNQEIAIKLCLEGGTVKNYVSAIYGKLGVNTRAQAVNWVWSHPKGRNSLFGEREEETRLAGGGPDLHER